MFTAVTATVTKTVTTYKVVNVVVNPTFDQFHREADSQPHSKLYVYAVVRPDEREGGNEESFPGPGFSGTLINQNYI